VDPVLGEIRILLADGQPLFLDAVRAAIDAEADLRIVATAGDGIQAVAEVQRERPHVAVIDLDLPNGDGLRTTRQIAQSVPDCRVLVLAEREDPEALLRAIQAGASGFVARSSLVRELVEAARKVRAGETVVPPLLLPGLISSLVRRRREQDDAAPRMSRLTGRERQVLNLLAEGADNDQIARILVISPETARTHVQNALGKLGVHSRLEAVALITRTGILADLGRAKMIARPGLLRDEAPEDRSPPNESRQGSSSPTGLDLG
jgi:DNA-binding NarL/FixJ family response regulator